METYLDPKIIVKCKGGIGNQFFQIFFAIAQSLQHGVEYGIYINDCSQFSFYFFFFVKLYSNLSLDNVIYREKRENPLDAIDRVGNIPVIFDGYFQDYRYFHNYANKIKDILHIDWLRENMANRIRHKIDFSLKRTRIMVHIRRGDYTSQPCFHHLLQNDYYRESMKTLMETIDTTQPIDLLLFCQSREGVDDDISQFVEDMNLLYDFDKIYYVGDMQLTDAEELLLMTWCSHFIIANSTFSWWGAYLCPNADKVVCCPDLFFGHQLYYIETEGLYLPGWKRISHKVVCPCREWCGYSNGWKTYTA